MGQVVGQDVSMGQVVMGQKVLGQEVGHQPCQVRSHACEGRPGCAQSHVMNEICLGLYLVYETC